MVSWEQDMPVTIAAPLPAGVSGTIPAMAAKAQNHYNYMIHMYFIYI